MSIESSKIIALQTCPFPITNHFLYVMFPCAVAHHILFIHRKPRPKPKPKHLQKSPPPPLLHPSQSNPLIAQGTTIEELLRSIGMLKYLDVFHEHNLIMVTDCFDMTEDDLEKMGITLGGHQYKIVKNIRIKQEELGTQSPF